MKCCDCGKTPKEISEYVEAAKENNMTPTRYVATEEGTYNSNIDRFCCTECYIKRGCPATSKGWKAQYGLFDIQSEMKNKETINSI